MILQPNNKFIDYIFKSAHYLNCPIHMFNSNIDDMYRQGISFGIEKAIENVENLFKFYKYNGNAKKWVEWRNSITLKVFTELNPNWGDDLPKHIQRRHNYINNWFTCHTDYSMGYKVVASYPFQKH